MKVPAPEILTVKNLREYLDMEEAAWTEEDVKYLGTFEHQKINTLHYEGDNPVFKGIGNATIYYHGGLDFVIVPSENKHG